MAGVVVRSEPSVADVEQMADSDLAKQDFSGIINYLARRHGPLMTLHSSLRAAASTKSDAHSAAD